MADDGSRASRASSASRWAGQISGSRWSSYRAKKITREAAVRNRRAAIGSSSDIFEKASTCLSERSHTERMNNRIMKNNTTMQLGMIGLGRMGANMVRRLIKGGHMRGLRPCRRQRSKNWSTEKATGASSLADFVKKLDQAAGDLADGAGGGRGPDHRRSAAAARSGRHPHRWRQLLLRRRHPAREGTRDRREFTTSTSARAAACGGWSAATA